MSMRVLELDRKICPECGKLFKVSPGDYNYRVYCSIECKFKNFPKRQHERILQKGKRGRSYYKEDLGHCTRSFWETNICRLYKALDKKYEYESKKCRFNLGELGILILDTYLPDDNIWIEIKGYLSKKAKEKLKIFCELYPEVAKRTLVLDKEAYEELKIKFYNKIDWNDYTIKDEPKNYCLQCHKGIKNDRKYCSKDCFYKSLTGHSSWSKGLTKETDERLCLGAQKISLSMTGHQVLSATREKVSERLTGKPKSEEHRKNIGLARIGKIKVPRECVVCKNCQKTFIALTSDEREFCSKSCMATYNQPWKYRSLGIKEVI